MSYYLISIFQDGWVKLCCGGASIAKAINDARAAKKQLEETRRHNKTMEAMSMGKGLYLKPYKTGLGLFLDHSYHHRHRHHQKKKPQYY